MSLPAKVRKRIWKYVRSERLCYRYGRGVGEEEHPDDKPEWLDPWNRQVQSFDGLLLACRLTYAETFQLVNPTTMRTRSFLLNDALRVMESQWDMRIDEMEIILEGEAITGNEDEIDIEDVRDEIATSLLEIKRQYQDVSFAEIRWLHVGMTEETPATREKAEFRMRYIVNVGKVRPQTLGGYISTPQRYCARGLAREKALFPSCLRFAKLDHLLNDMRDTPEGGADAWVVKLNLGGSDAQFVALMDDRFPELKEATPKYEGWRSIFDRARD